MKAGGEAEADARRVDAAPHAIRAKRDVDAKGLEDIGAAAAAGGGADVLEATGMPAPAATSAAAVEMLNVPARSPPVPQVSMAPEGRSSGVACARIDSTKPVISSTVSPFARSAISRPAIWTGVASPAIT